MLLFLLNRITKLLFLTNFTRNFFNTFSNKSDPLVIKDSDPVQNKEIKEDLK